MRVKNLIWGDIRFQIKYGFYLLYGLVTLLYLALLSFIPADYKKSVAGLIIFTDPATLGLFFMGSIVLLEKSQRVLASLAVSPLRVSEYIFSKVFSLGLLSSAVAMIIGGVSGTHSIWWTGISTWVGSVVFSLIGIILATKANSLNGFILLTVPIMLVMLLPAIGEVLGYRYAALIIHPGVALFQLIEGNWQNLPLLFLILLLWLGVFFFWALKATDTMWKRIGGIKL